MNCLRRGREGSKKSQTFVFVECERSLREQAESLLSNVMESFLSAPPALRLGLEEILQCQHRQFTFKSMMVVVDFIVRQMKFNGFLHPNDSSKEFLISCKNVRLRTI